MQVLETSSLTCGVWTMSDERGHLLQILHSQQHLILREMLSEDLAWQPLPPRLWDRRQERKDREHMGIQRTLNTPEKVTQSSRTFLTLPVHQERAALI